jgi:oxygen-dependent protoporphyrinogen oxidase
MKIKVIGSGFSGLTTAYFANLAGFDVEVIESSARAGGLLSTESTPFGLVESAANGLLNSSLVEQLFLDVGATICPMKKTSKARYIFKDGVAKRWPLSFGESSSFIFRWLAASPGLKKRWRPKPSESIRDWGYRTIGPAAAENLLFPALQGIYAGNPLELSATLILARHFNSGQKKFPPLSKVRGTVCAPGGMGQLMTLLETYLQSRGVGFKKNLEIKRLSDVDGAGATIISTSVASACDILQGTEAEGVLRQIDVLPVVSITSWYSLGSSQIKGFGCLFPRSQNVRALGVLFNDQIFEGRSQYLSETWIYGGATDRSFIDFSDSEMVWQLAQDRALLYGQKDKPIDQRITRWPKAIPHYSLQLENLLKNQFQNPVDFKPVIGNVYLHGNYLGSLGLSKILERSKFLVDSIQI